MSDSNGQNQPKPDTTDMARLHQVFRDAIADGPRYIGGVAPGDTERSALVGSYYFNVLALLKGHHAGEDLLVTPLLLERCNAEDAATAKRIGEQHERVHQPVLDADAAIVAWALTADPEGAALSLRRLEEVSNGLISHLEEEEAELLPIVAEYLTLEEWGQLPMHGIQTFTGDNIWLILGLIREQMNAEQRDNMTANMPPPVVEAWQTIGESEFLTFVGELRT
jgi:Hemerythrin HHE cation binding domain